MERGIISIKIKCPHCHEVGKVRKKIEKNIEETSEKGLVGGLIGKKNGHGQGRRYQIVL